jgi:uncharacterized membrane protein
MDVEKLKLGLAAMSGGSATLTTWALAILGGTIAAIIGSDYLQPTGRMKLVYLLFIPGWVLLARSLYFGDQLNSSFMASALSNNVDMVMTIGMNMDQELLKQRQYLSYALSIFGIWLICFLLWWIFTNRKIHEHSTNS